MNDTHLRQLLDVLSRVSVPTRCSLLPCLGIKSEEDDDEFSSSWLRYNLNKPRWAALVSPRQCFDVTASRSCSASCLNNSTVFLYPNGKSTSDTHFFGIVREVNMYIVSTTSRSLTIRYDSHTQV
jgi:hypothetical protein